jgi:hypothetical protein
MKIQCALMSPRSITLPLQLALRKSSSRRWGCCQCEKFKEVNDGVSDAAHEDHLKEEAPPCDCCREPMEEVPEICGGCEHQRCDDCEDVPAIRPVCEHCGHEHCEECDLVRGVQVVLPGHDTRPGFHTDYCQGSLQGYKAGLMRGVECGVIARVAGSSQPSPPSEPSPPSAPAPPSEATRQPDCSGTHF